ncbi:MAG: PilW family protein [Nitrospiraceae bacterium]
MRYAGRWERGFTVVEVMVATVITTVVVAAALTTVVTSNKATQVNEQVADVQQNVRLAMELISRDIKLAGFNMTGTIGTCTVGSPAQPAPIVPGDNTPIGLVGAINDVGPDSVRLVVPALTAGNAGGTPVLSAAGGGGINTIQLSAADITAMGAAGLGVGSVVSVGGSFSSPITIVGATMLTLANATQVSVQFPIGTPVYLLQCVQYAISTNPATCGGSTSCLLRNGVPMVDGIEDLQLAYACDGCNTAAPNPSLPNGVLDDQDGSGGTFTTGDFITNNNWDTPPMSPDKIKLVQITIVARQNQADQGLSETGALGVNTPGPVVVSDHNPSNDATYNAIFYQQQRRRVLTRTIQVRNIES